MGWSSRYVRLSLPRLWMREHVYFGSKVPTIGGASTFPLPELVALRRRSGQLPISWGAILMKAVALVARGHPELRRSYLPFPWPHFYEHPHCIAATLVERRWRDEKAVFYDVVLAPEQKSLRQIDRELRWMKAGPIEAIGNFRRLIRHTRLPPPFRRLMWRISLHGSGRLRSRYIGTLLVSSFPSYRHGFPTQAMTLPTMSFYHGSVMPNGNMPLQVFCDHRVIDGAAVARILADLYGVLQHEIVAELGADAERQPSRTETDTE